MEYHPARVRDLANNDPRLRLLWTEHAAFEQRLEAMNSYRFLTPAEQMERRHLQKLKLARKDDMAKILAGYPPSD